MADDDSNQIQKIDLDKVDWKSSREFFESLGEELDKLDNKDEAYDFTWVGKRKAIIEAGAPVNKTFRPNVEESKDWDTTENLFIEGDNLDALKLLQESYLGKVKIIYIDPPYNTGKDFVYHDNFKARSEVYDEDTEYKDGTGNIQFKKNEKTNGRYHSDWLSMMYPRLKLARNLLTNDGAIFISIGNDERSNLQKLGEEVFGEDNFIGDIAVKSTPGGQQSSVSLSSMGDYLLVFGKSADSSIQGTPLTDEEMKKYNQEDEDGKYLTGRLRQHGIAERREDVPTLYFPIFYNKNNKAVSTTKQDGFDIEVLPVLPAGGDGRWIWSKEKIEKDKNLLHIKQIKRNGELVWDVYFKKYYNDTMRAKLPSIILDNDVRTEVGSKEVRALFDGKKFFDYPKPVYTIRKLISSFADIEFTVLDFFSGSGSTAHAVMQLNAEDGGNRKHIQVQLPEGTDEKSEAFKAGYKTIPEIARERIRRAGEKIKDEFKDELAKREKPLDVGFRTLTVTDTNYKEVFKPVGEHTQESLLDTVDNVKKDRSELDLLYGVLVKSALELNRPIEKKEIAGADVYLYDYFSEVSGLVACFAGSVPEETIKEIAKLKPLTAVFKDSSFESSQDKVNLAEHFRILSPDTKVKVV